MITKSLKWAGFIAVLAFSNSALAYKAKYTSDGCKKPRFNNMLPVAYNSDTKIEAEQGAEISFTVSSDAEIGSLNVSAKKIPLKYKSEFKGSYYEVTTNLPAALNGKYARISVDVNAMMGCLGKDGWLVKIK